MLHVPADACYASVTSDREAAISIEKGPDSRNLLLGHARRAALFGWLVEDWLHPVERACGGREVSKEREDTADLRYSLRREASLPAVSRIVRKEETAARAKGLSMEFGMNTGVRQVWEV